MKGIIQGLAIFQANGGTYVSAEHDIIRAGQKPGNALTPIEVETLIDLGWNQDSEFCDCPREKDSDNEFNAVHGLDCSEWYYFT